MDRRLASTFRVLAGAGLMAALLAIGYGVTGDAQGTPVWVTTVAPTPTLGYTLGVVAGGNGKIYTIGGWGYSADYEYDPTEDTWTFLGHYSCASTGVAESGGKIHVAGGCGGGSYTNRLEIYDPASNTWRFGAGMSVARDLFGAAAVDGVVYSLSGRTNHAPHTLTSTVEAYDTVHDTWTTRAPMKTARHYFSVVAVNGKVYAIGGAGYAGGLSSMEEYDPHTDTWTEAPCMPSPRGATSAAVGPDGRIYVIGGAPDSPYQSSVVRYDPVSKIWESGSTPSPIPRHQSGAATANGKIFVMGGIAGGYGIPTEAYDPGADTWVVTPSDPACGPVPDTTPPVIGAVSDLTVEATSAAGAFVTFALPAVTDAGDSAPVVTASPASGSTFPLGATTVTVTARDASGNSSTASFTVTVGDTTPPAMTVPVNIVVDASGSGGAVVAFAASALDRVDGLLTPTCSPASGSTFRIGVTSVFCSATDAGHNTGSATFTVTVRSKPVLTIVSLTPAPAILWPPNHKMVSVTVSAKTSAAAGGPAPVCRITGATSSEPDNGLGDGDTAGDIGPFRALAVSLRAERAGSGPGRTYTLTVTCSDMAGNSATKATTVTVPKSQGK